MSASSIIERAPPGSIPAGTPLPADKLDKLEQKPQGGQNYKGFVAGVFSGIAKLSGA